MKNTMIFIAVIGVLFVAVSFFDDTNSCESLCTTNESCMQMLADEGIAPFGSTRNDKGLCNGVCGALRMQIKQAKQQAKQFGEGEGEFDYSNACMPKKS